MDNSFYINLDETSYGGNKIRITGFDEELATHAEELSAKWTSLYRYHIDDEDVKNASIIIKSSGTGVNHMGLIGKQDPPHDPKSTSKPEFIVDERKIILLDKKYFKFDSNDERNEQETSAKDSILKNTPNAEIYSTVFGSSDSDLSCDEGLGCVAKVDLPPVEPKRKPNNEPKESSKGQPKKKPPKSAPKSKKTKNQRQKPISLSDFNSGPSTDIPAHLLGAPPGVTNTTGFRRNNFDISKNSKCSLQFQL